MGSVNIAINQRAILISETKTPGLKTLYVKPLNNWQAGVIYPLSPADIDIVIQNKVGATVEHDTVHLPAVGFAQEFQGDGIDVEVYYNPRQGLAIPYPLYILEAGLVEGPKAVGTTKIFWSADQNVAQNVYYPAAGLLPIPDFSSELRINATCLGAIILRSTDPVNGSLEYYDFGLCSRWLPFGSDMYQWQIWIIQPGSSPIATVSVEFR